MSAALSVIIVNYNAGPLLRGCVDSLLACQLDVEIIVVDNASRDESLAYLEASISDCRLCIIRNGKNPGFASACNVGARASNADTVLFINPDSVLTPGALR